MKLNERILIQFYLEEGFSIKKIAKKLNKALSTITREIVKYKYVKRNNKIIELKKRTDEEILNNHPCEILKKVHIYVMVVLDIQVIIVHIIM